MLSSWSFFGRVLSGWAFCACVLSSWAFCAAAVEVAKDDKNADVVDECKADIDSASVEVINVTLTRLQ